MKGKTDFSKGPVWRCIVAQALPLTLILPRPGLGVMGVFLVEPVSNIIGGAASYLTMRMTVYKKLSEKL